MSLRTKYFGKKVWDEELQDLFGMIGIPLPDFSERDEGSYEIYARYRIIPRGQGFEIDVYLFVDLLCIQDEALRGDPFAEDGDMYLVKGPRKHFVKRLGSDQFPGFLSVVRNDSSEGRLSDVVEGGLTFTE